MNNSIKLFKKASHYLDNKDYNKALKLFKKIYNNGDNEAGVNIGYIYDKIGKKRKAIKWYKKLLKEQNDTTVMINLGILYKEQYKLKKAKRCFKKASKIGDGDASLELAKIYLCEAKLHKLKKYLLLAKDSLNSCESSRLEAKQYLKRLLKFEKKI